MIQSPLHSNALSILNEYHQTYNAWITYDPRSKYGDIITVYSWIFALIGTNNPLNK